MKWVELDESYEWRPDLGPPEDTAYRYEDRLTLREKFPQSFKQVPDELFDRLVAARATLEAIQQEIDALGDRE